MGPVDVMKTKGREWQRQHDKTTKSPHVQRRKNIAGGERLGVTEGTGKTQSVGVGL